MDIEKREVYRAIAEMAYVIAKADKGLSAEERMKFNQIVEAELDDESWAAQSRFELLDEVLNPSSEKAYKDALHELRIYKSHFTPSLREKTIKVMSQVAEVCNGFSNKERNIIERFKNDIEKL